MGQRRSPMTIFFESWGSAVLQVYSQNILNLLKSDVLSRQCKWSVTKCNRCFVYCVYFILSHVNLYIGTIQKPHDHLFEKLWQLGIASLIPKSPKKQFLLRQCNEMHSKRGKLCRLHPFTCNSLWWDHTEAPWPFISKGGADGYCKFTPQMAQNPKKQCFVAAV